MSIEYFSTPFKDKKQLTIVIVVTLVFGGVRFLTSLGGGNDDQYSPAPAKTYETSPSKAEANESNTMVKDSAEIDENRNDLFDKIFANKPASEPTPEKKDTGLEEIEKAVGLRR